MLSRELVIFVVLTGEGGDLIPTSIRHYPHIRPSHSKVDFHSTVSLSLGFRF